MDYTFHCTDFKKAIEWKTGNCQLFQETVINLLKKCSRKLRKLQIANCDPPVRVHVKLDIRTRI